MEKINKVEESIACNNCGSNNIKIEQRIGRGLPPKDLVRKQGDNRKISWQGTWNICICNDCGNEISKNLIG